MERHARSLGGRRRARGSRGRIARQPKHYLTLERLERRDLLTVLMWIGGDGNFGDANKWTDGGTLHQVPGLGDTALFGSGAYSVTIADGQQVDALKFAAGATVTFAGNGLFRSSAASLDAAHWTVHGAATQVEVTTDLVMSGAAQLTSIEGAIVLVGQTLDLGSVGEVTAQTGAVFVGVTGEQALGDLLAPANLAGRFGSLAYLAARDINLNLRSGATPINQSTGGFSTTGMQARYLPGSHVDYILLTTRDTLTIGNGYFNQNFLQSATLTYEVTTGKLKLTVPLGFVVGELELGLPITLSTNGQLIAYADVGLPGQPLDFTTLTNQFNFAIDEQATFLTFAGSASLPGFPTFTLQPQSTGSLVPHFGGNLVANFTSRTGAQPATIQFLEASLIRGINLPDPVLPGPLLESGGLQVLPQGTFAGHGRVLGNLTNDGLIRVQSPNLPFAPEFLTITGNYTQTSFGTLQLDVTPDYVVLPAIVVSGATALDNRLRLNLVGDFSQRIDPLRAVSSQNTPISGGFSKIEGNRAGNTYFSLVQESAIVGAQPQQAALVVETSPNFYTDESGKTATFGVKLAAPPTAPVTVQIGTSDSSEGTATKLAGGNTLVFSVDNWDQAQTVIVTGVDDLLADGDISYFVNLHIVSDDLAYAGLADVRTPLVNRDNETSQEKLAAIRLKVTDTQGNVLPEVSVGQTFYLEMRVDDLRGELPGSLLAAYADIIYSAARAGMSGPAVFSSDYPLDHSLSTTSAGLLDELGAATTTELGSAERLLVRVPLVATSEGLLGFTANAAGGAGHGVRLSGLAGSLPPNRVDFGNTSVEVVPDTNQSVDVTLRDATPTAEGNDGLTPVNFQVELSQVPTAPITVFYRVFASVGDTATADTDFVAETGSVTFTPAEATRFKNIVAHVKGDVSVEGNETFHVEITSVEGAGNVVRSLAAGTIVNDDVLATASITNAAPKNEGNSGDTPFEFAVSLSQGIDAPVTVSYRIVAGSGNTATAGEDFVAREGSITFDAAAGPQSKNIVALVHGDGSPELSETFRVELTGVSGPTQLGQAVATGTILNDDPPNLLMDDVRQLEGTGGDTVFVFRVRLSHVSDDTITVFYQVGQAPLLAVPAGNATPGADFTSGAGFLTFNPGDTEQTFEVHVAADNIEEDNEAFYVGLYDVRNDRVGPVRRGIIVDDDDNTNNNLPDQNAPEAAFENGRAEIDGLIGAGGSDGNGGSGELVDLLLTEKGPAGLTGDWDFTRFELARTTVVRIEVLAERLPTPSSLDAVLALLKLDGVNGADLKIVATNDDTIGRDPVIEVELPAGKYAVGVGGAQGTRGPYRLVIQTDPPPVVDHMSPGNTLGASPGVLTLFLNEVDVDPETVLKQAFELLAEDPITHALTALNDVLGDPRYLPGLHRILVPLSTSTSLADGKYLLRVAETILGENGAPLRSALDLIEGIAFAGSFAVDTLAPVLLANSLRVGGATSTAAGLLYRLVGQVIDAAPATAGEQVRVELDIDGDGEFDDGFATLPLKADGSTSFSVSATTALPFSGGLRDAAVRFVDARGNVSPPFTLSIDTNLPIVTDVRAATTGPKVLVSFSRDDLQNIDQAANYTISNRTIIAVVVSADHRTVELTLDDLPDGVYALSVHTGAGKIFAPGQATTDLVANSKETTESAQAEAKAQADAQLDAAEALLLDGNFDGTPGDDFTGKFTVDRTAPSITSVKLQSATGAGNRTNDLQPTLLVTVNDVFPGVPAESPLTLSIDLDGDGVFEDGTLTFTQGASNQPNTVAIQINRPLTAGEYTARLRLLDTAGNVAPAIAEFKFTVDRLGPKIVATQVDAQRNSNGQPTGVVTIALEFDEDLDPVAAADLLTYRLLSAGGDGNLYDADPGTEQTDAITSRVYQSAAQTGGRARVTIVFDLAGRPADDYQLVVSGQRLVDRAGNRLIGGDYRVDPIQWSAPGQSRVIGAEFASTSVSGASELRDLVVLRFSGPDLVASQVENLNNYALVRLDAPAGPVGLSTVSYDPLTNRAILRLSAPVADGSYELTIRAGTGEIAGINSLAGFPLLGPVDLLEPGDIVLPVTVGELATFQNLLDDQFPSLAQYADEVTLDAANSRKAVANLSFATRLLQELQLAGSLTGNSQQVAAAINAALAQLIAAQLGGVEADNLATQGEFVVLWSREARFLLGGPSNTNVTGDKKRVGQNDNGLLIQEIPGATLVQVNTADGPLMLVILPIEPRADLLGTDLVSLENGQPAVPSFLYNLELEGFVPRNQAGYLFVHNANVIAANTFADVAVGTDADPFTTRQFNLAPTITGVDPNIELINQHVRSIVEGIFGPLSELDHTLLWGWIDPVDYALGIGQSQLGSQGGQSIDTSAGGSIANNGATGLVVWSGAPSGIYNLAFNGLGTPYRGALNFNDGTNSLYASVQGELGLGSSLLAQVDFRLPGSIGPPGTIDLSGALAAAASTLRAGAGSTSALGLFGSALSPAIRTLASAGGDLGVGGMLNSILQMAGHVGRQKAPPTATALLGDLLQLRGDVARNTEFIWMLPEVDRLIAEARTIDVNDVVARHRIDRAIDALKKKLGGGVASTSNPTGTKSRTNRSAGTERPAAPQPTALRRGRLPAARQLGVRERTVEPPRDGTATSTDPRVAAGAARVLGSSSPAAAVASTATASTVEGSSDASR